MTVLTNTTNLQQGLSLSRFWIGVMWLRFGQWEYIPIFKSVWLV